MMGKVGARVAPQLLQTDVLAVAPQFPVQLHPEPPEVAPGEDDGLMLAIAVAIDEMAHDDRDE